MSDNEDTTEQQPKYQIIETSEYRTDDIIYNQIYDEDTKDYTFLGWNTKSKTLVQSDAIYIENNKVIKPINDDLAKKQVVVLPTGVIDYKDIDTLEQDIDKFIQKYLDISDEHREKAIWYIELTWIIDILYGIPYLRALGTYGSGKTRYEDVIGGICYKSINFGASPTSATIYRLMQTWKGTLLLDEFNLKSTDENADIVQILNTGYQRKKYIYRCNKNNNFKIEAFSPFGAKILCSKNRFKDEALESRCITEVMKETSRKDIPSILGEEFYRDRQILQNKLLKFRFDNLNKFNPNVELNVDNLIPRIKQTFNPFVVLFSDNPERLKRFEEYVKSYNDEVVYDNSISFDGCIVKAYIDLNNTREFVNKEGIITSTDILNYLISLKLANDDTKVNYIGSRLKTLGFETKSVKVKGKTHRNVTIDKCNLDKLGLRYVPNYEVKQ